MPDLGLDAASMGEARLLTLFLDGVSKDARTMHRFAIVYRLIRESERLADNLTQLLPFYYKRRASEDSVRFDVRGHASRSFDQVDYVYWRTISPEGRNIYHEAFIDSPFAIVLMGEERPVALSAFHPRDASTLMITQLQAVHYSEAAGLGHARCSPPEIESLRWEKLLVELTAEFGRDAGFRQIGVQSAYNNRWIRPGGLHLPLDRALLRYDHTASRLKFRQGEDLNWYRPVCAGSASGNI